MTELLPCPFCGGGSRTYRTIVGRFVACCNNPFCASVGPFGTEAEAVAAWNTRIDDYKQAAEYWQLMYEQTFAERTCRNTSDSNYFRCSVCRKKTYRGEETFNYCPNCGAKVVDE